MISWEEMFKIRIANSSGSMLKHEVVKIILVLKLLENHKKDRNFIRIYTEFYVKDNLKCDVYFENMQTKEVYAYEIQKNYSEKWLKERKEKYKDWEVHMFETCDWIPIDLNKLSDDIYIISKEVEKYIF